MMTGEHIVILIRHGKENTFSCSAIHILIQRTHSNPGHILIQRTHSHPPAPLSFLLLLLVARIRSSTVREKIESRPPASHYWPWEGVVSVVWENTFSSIEHILIQRTHSHLPPLEFRATTRTCCKSDQLTCSFLFLIWDKE